MTALSVVLGVLFTLLVLWTLFAVALFVLRPKDLPLKEMVRLVPDLVRLLRALGRDGALARGARWQVGFLLVYLVLPIDLIPDFIPVIGFADDAILTYIVLRNTLKHTDPELVDRSWTGSPEGLATIRRLLRV